MGWLQPWHIILIVVVALILFGPSRLPEIGRSVGKTIKEFQSATKETTQALSEELSKPAGTVAVAEAKPAQVNCKECGKPMQAGMKFCPECGKPQ